MVHEIKMEKLMTPLTQGKITQNTKQEAPVTEEQGITVTNNMSKLLNLLSSDAQLPDENTRVMDIKRRIDAGEYKVDIDKLSAKLLSSGVLETLGE